jgi:lysophospholipase L1-like esterase
LVVGVSDIAKKTEGQWRSYPNIIQIRDAQRNAAAKTNSAYWDLFEVMGGENSILAWAGTNPPLAGKDYIHLTPKGAQVVGEFLFQSLLKDYRSYSNSKNAKNNPL